MHSKYQLKKNISFQSYPRHKEMLALNEYELALEPHIITELLVNLLYISYFFVRFLNGVLANHCIKFG